MTISVHLSGVNARLTAIERCAERAPEGTYQRARDAAAAINEMSNNALEVLRLYGFKALNDDRLRNLEAAMYEYLLISNPDDAGLTVGEGFGEAVDGPRGAQVLANAGRDRDALLALKASR